MNTEDRNDIQTKLDRLAEELNGRSLVDDIMRRVADSAVTPARSLRRGRHLMTYWRRIAIAAAALVVVAALAFTLSEQSPSRAYALQQTIDAIDQVETVHFKAKFYVQGDVECWMEYADQADDPTYMCLFWPNTPLRKVDTPNGSFLYNERTNRLFRTVRDERGKGWLLDFAGFLQDALANAEKDGTTRISSETDPGTQREVIVVDVDEGNRQCKYYIDPDTKLPVRVATTPTGDIRELMRSPIAVESMELIEYNLPVPEGMFDIPADAQVVDNEHDIIFHPGVGLQVDGLAPQDACVKLVHAAIDAMNAFDFERFEKLVFPFVTPPDDTVQQMKASAAGKPVWKLLELGEPYEEGGYWYIRAKTEELGGRIKDELLPIRFHEFEGHTYCMVMWPD